MRPGEEDEDEDEELEVVELPSVRSRTTFCPVSQQSTSTEVSPGEIRWMLAVSRSARCLVASASSDLAAFFSRAASAPRARARALAVARVTSRRRSCEPPFLPSSWRRGFERGKKKEKEKEKGA